MSGNQDQAPETAAGDLDGLFETASKGGRMDTDPDAPQMIAAQVQKRSDLDSVLPPRNNTSERIKLGEAQEVATKPTGTGMNDLISSSGRMRIGGGGQADASAGSSMDDVFGGGGSTSGRMRIGRAQAAPTGGLDDLLDSGGAKPKRKAPTGGTMDDFLSPPKRR